MSVFNYNTVPLDGNIAYLILVKAGVPYRFTGEPIPDVAEVLNAESVRGSGADYVDYRLKLADGVKPYPGHGTMTGPLAGATYIEVANAMGVPFNAARLFIAKCWQSRGQHLDAMERNLLAFEANQRTERAIVTIGGPTRREVLQGFWERPICIVDRAGDTIGIVRGQVDDWTELTRDGEVQVHNVCHAEGPGGGYYSLEIEFPLGCSWKHG